MPKVTYAQTLQQDVEIEVTDAELALLRGNDERWRTARDKVRQRVIDEAITRFEERKNGEPVVRIEWVQSDCWYEDDVADEQVELFAF